LIANGTNVGRKVDGWLPVVGSTHPYCFAYSLTPVYTSNGWKKIKDMKVGDLVLTHRGRFRKVNNLIFRSISKLEVGSVFTITVKVNDKYTLKIRKVTGEHPFLCNGIWKSVNRLKVGDKLSILNDECSYSLCNNRIPIYYRVEETELTANKCCSYSCAGKYSTNIEWSREEYRKRMTVLGIAANKRRYEKMSREDRRKLTESCRRGAMKLFENGTHPLTSNEVRRRANSSNGKRCSFIELKLRYFLDKLGIKYKIDFCVERNESKSNGQNKLYFPDIYIEDLNIVIEADGENWHEDTEYDLKRDRDIKELIGADTFRFKESDIRNNGDMVYKELERIIKNHKGIYSFSEVEIVDIEEYRYRSDDEIMLYNLSVEEDESYIVNGIVTHNCRGDIRWLPNGQKWNEESGQFEYSSDRERKVERKSKIKVTVGSKEFLV